MNDLAMLQIYILISSYLFINLRQITEILYTALNLPSLISVLYKSEIDSQRLEFTPSPIFLHNPLHLIKFKIHPQVRRRK